MSATKTIDVQAEPVPANPHPQPQPAQSLALARVETGAVSTKPLSPEQIHERLEFIRSVMAREMKEGQDYGKIPGCGEKPSLLQPGAQKLLLTFQLREQVVKEILREFPNLHREYEITVAVFPAGATAADW